jgi:hypothetical protein
MMYRESIPLAASPMDTESSKPPRWANKQRRSIAKRLDNLCSNSGRCGGPKNPRKKGPHTNKKTIKVGKYGGGF